MEDTRGGQGMVSVAEVLTAASEAFADVPDGPDQIIIRRATDTQYVSRVLYPASDEYESAVLDVGEGSS